ncbi:MAG: hypothetical protein ACE5KZ_05335 [Candidatus Scalinduaceae bacterium]
MEECNKYKQCPMCAEDIRVDAAICRYCMTDVYNDTKVKEGRFVKIKLKVGDIIYKGDIFVHGCTKRVSDVVNDKRQFISLLNTCEEVESSDHDLEIGYIALNKNVIEWVRVVET